MLEAAGLAEAKAVVLAIDDPETVTRMTEYIARRHPGVKIIARAHDRHHVYELYAAGTQHSVREVFDSAVRAGKYALEALEYSEQEIDSITSTFVEHDREMLAELAEMWDPNVPAHQNDDYIAKAREQTLVIEAAMNIKRGDQEKAAE